MTITKKMIEKAAREYLNTLDNANEQSALRNALYNATNEANGHETLKLFAQVMDAAQLCDDDNEQVKRVANVAYDSVETLIVQRLRFFCEDETWGHISFGRFVQETLINLSEICAIVNEAISAAE